MRIFGLIGRQLGHSFSAEFFFQKFEAESINDAEYLLFEHDELSQFKAWISGVRNLRGLNVTVPYKEAIIPFLDELDPISQSVGAVNTIDIRNGWLKGYNTDVFGFNSVLKPLLSIKNNSALVFGSGGASKAVQFVLHEMGIPFLVVSRNPKKDEVLYEELTQKLVTQHPILINTTPLGMFPLTDSMPKIPYSGVTQNHLAIDLVYNPTQTRFMMECERRGARITNGLAMLHAQAEKSWQIWNSTD